MAASYHLLHLQSLTASKLRITGRSAATGRFRSLGILALCAPK
jgi:hypothetical protein